MPTEPPPIGTDFAILRDPSEQRKFKSGWVITRPWVRWFGVVTNTVDKAAVLEASVRLTAQAVSLGATAFSLGSIPPGIYRVNYNFQITRRGTTSSSLTFTITWTQNGQSMTGSGVAATGNTLTTGQGGSFIIRSDNGTPINYATTYASAGATAMQYSLDVSVQALRLD